MPRCDLVVLDFETSGLSPSSGDRPIEIGAVKVKNGRVVEEFQSLMNPGFKINGFIQSYTGITNQMLAKAPPCELVMAEFSQFIAGQPLVAHNASFDRKFLDAELGHIGQMREKEFACTMLAARRVFHSAPNYQLGTLVEYLKIQSSGRAHRALADAQATWELWSRIVDELRSMHRLKTVPFSLIHQLGQVPKKKVPDFLTAQVEAKRP